MESKQTLPTVKEEDATVFADKIQYGSPLTSQVFTSLNKIRRRTDICRVSPMAYQERVGPLSFMQARAAY
eukprot:6677684-Prorocentrum_lima.AAC.1